MAAQVATESLGIRQVIAKINDPVRAAAYAELGVVTLCRTNLMVDTVAQYLSLPMSIGPGIDTPEIESHRHPHPTAGGLPVAGGLPGASAAAETAHNPPSAAPAPRGSSGSSSPTPGAAQVKEIEAARARRLGFRRGHS